VLHFPRYDDKHFITPKFSFLPSKWRTVIDFLRNCADLGANDEESIIDTSNVSPIANVNVEMMDAMGPLLPSADNISFNTAVHYMDKYWHFRERLIAGNITEEALVAKPCIPWTAPVVTQPDSSSIALVTISSKASDAPLSLKDKEQYAKKHGYTFYPIIGAHADRPASWWKLPAMFTVFNQYEWVMLFDLDTVILDHSVQLEEFLDPRADFIVGGEPEGPDTWKDILNCGIFIARNTTWTRFFLMEAWGIADVPYENPGDGLWEQTAINRLTKDEHQVRNHVKVIPANLFNRFLPNRWNVKSPVEVANDTFVLHLTGSANKYELLEHYFSIRRHVVEEDVEMPSAS
jgi:galactosyl transferase GMA12/MNN10 family